MALLACPYCTSDIPSAAPDFPALVALDLLADGAFADEALEMLPLREVCTPPPNAVDNERGTGELPRDDLGDWSDRAPGEPALAERDL